MSDNEPYGAQREQEIIDCAWLKNNELTKASRAITNVIRKIPYYGEDTEARDKMRLYLMHLAKCASEQFAFACMSYNEETDEIDIGLITQNKGFRVTEELYALSRYGENCVIAVNGTPVICVTVSTRGFNKV